ncbi:MAG: flagellin-like protein [Candidatus Nanohaloarchaea archaeon]|jgi:flagellin-like protein
MNRKGVSPIIASVLLLAVSLAVVGIFSGWAPELAQDVTQSTSNSTYETIACNEASVEIRSAYYSSSDVTLSVRNNGDEDLNNLSLVAFDQNGQILAQENDVSIASGQISEKTISGAGSEPAYVEALSGQCGSVTYRIDDINT